MKNRQLLLISTFLLLLFPLSLSAKASLHQVDFSPQELKIIQGHYSTIYGYLYIQVRGKQVSTNFDGKYIQLVKKSNGRFYPRYKLLKLIPISLGSMSFSLNNNINNNKGENQILMHQRNKKTQTVAQKFTASVVPNLWKQRLGKYKATLLKGDSKIKKIRLAIKRGVLVAYINKISNPYPLLALSASKIFSPSAGHNSDQPISILANKTGLNLNYADNKLILKKF
ncbi:MAG: hypothetical protein V3V19_05475 [Cocleimonas sp.]